MPQRPGQDRPFQPEKRALPARLRPGMTLIELMIVLLVSIIILGAAFSLYQVNARYYVAQDALLEQQQNLRAALYSIARDVRMAGNGFGLIGGVNKVNIYVGDEFGAIMGAGGAGWFRYDAGEAPGVRAIFGRDGVGVDGSDTLTVFHAAIETPRAAGALAGEYRVGDDDTLTLQDVLKDDMLNDGDMIAVVSNGVVVVLEAEKINQGPPATIKIGSRFKPKSGAGLPGGNSLTNASVYRLRDLTLVTYFLEDGYRLMANYYAVTGDLAKSLYGANSGPVVLANDIEDFQVRYILDDQTPDNPLSNIVAEDEMDTAVLDNGRTVRAVRLALVSRSSRANETTAAGRPVSVFNHDVDGRPADGHQRRILTDTVYLRNY